MGESELDRQRRLVEPVAQHDQQLAQLAARDIVILGHEALPRVPGAGAV